MKLPALMLVLVVEAACACKGSSSGGGTGPGTGGTGSGTGTGSGSGTGDPVACDGQAEHVRGLYQAAAAHTDLTEGEIADNVAMVMKECKASPARIVPCLSKASAVAQLESSCLPRLDDEGTEGKVFLSK